MGAKTPEFLWRTYSIFLLHIFQNTFPRRQQSVGGLRFTGERRLTLKVPLLTSPQVLTHHIAVQYFFCLVLVVRYNLVGEGRLTQKVFFLT